MECIKKEIGELEYIMEDWKEIRLGDYVQFQNGYAFKSSDFKSDGKYKIIKIKELKDGLVKFFDDTANVDCENPGIINKYKVEKNDVLFALTGDPVSKPNPLSWVGRVSINRNDDKALLNQRTCKILKSDKIDNIFLYYYFRQWENFFSLASKATGSASQANISTSTIGDTVINLPPLPTQQKIAQILSSLDDKIELNNKINANLEQQAQALFKSWFVDFEPFGGKMPAGWKVGKLSEIGTVVGGSTPSKAKAEFYTENGIAWITPKDLSNDKSKFISHGEIDITEEGLKNSSAVVMPKGTVLYSSRAPIGYIAIAKNNVTTNQGFKSVIPNQNIGNAYIYYFLKTNFDLIDSMASGSTFKEISGSAMKNVPVIIPDNKTVSDFQNFCNDIFNQQQVLEEENKKLSNLRDSLLPKLMSGEIEV